MVKMSTAGLMKQKTTDVKGRKGRKGLDDDDVIPEIVPGLMGAKSELPPDLRKKRSSTKKRNKGLDDSDFRGGMANINVGAF